MRATERPTSNVMENLPAKERFYSDGAKYFGALMNGQRTGSGKLVLSQGSTFIGNFHNGLPHGLGYLAMNNGSEYHGKFQRGKFHGLGMFRHKNGDKVEGHFEQGVLHGNGVYRSSNSALIYQGLFEDGKFVREEYEDNTSASVNEVLRRVYELVQEYNTAQLS